MVNSPPRVNEKLYPFDITNPRYPAPSKLNPPPFITVAWAPGVFNNRVDVISAVIVISFCVARFLYRLYNVVKSGASVAMAGTVQQHASPSIVFVMRIIDPFGSC